MFVCLCVHDLSPINIGRSWAAASTEGLLIYSLDSGLTFDPYDLTMEVTPDNITAAVRDKLYASALVMSLRLNEYDLVVKVVESVPLQDSKASYYAIV